MSFANPTALAWFALALPVLVFYIMKLRLRRVPVSTVMFWQRIFEDKRPRSIWQRLRNLWSLLLQLLFLSLLVLAIGQPVFDWEILEARKVVLVIDNSASMSADDGDPTRLDTARKASLRLVDRLRSRDAMAVVSAGTSPRVLTGLTNHQRTLRQAIEGLPETDGSTQVAAAVKVARRLLAGAAKRKIIVVSDGCFPNADDVLDADDVRFVRVGKETPNAGITRFQVRRSAVDVLGYEILTEVRNHSDARVSLRFELELEGLPVDVVPLELEANGTWRKVFQKASSRGGRVVARLHGDGGHLPADDEAWGILPRREPQPVTLVSEGNHFLQMVFAANKLVRGNVTPALARAPAAREIVVFHQKVPDVIPPGWVLIVDPRNSCDLFTVGDAVPSPLITKTAKDSPLMAHVQLENVYLPEALHITPKKGPQILASAIDGEPVYLAWERPGQKVLALTVNLDKGDLPLRTAFPIMVSNSLSWFAGNAGELRESLATGEVHTLPIPGAPSDGAADTESWKLVSPSGSEHPLKVERGRTSIGPLEHRGVWKIAPKGKDAAKREPVEVASNLMNPAESDLRAPKGVSDHGEDAAEMSSGLFGWLGGKPTWFLLAFVAFLITTTEWCLYQRRFVA